MFFDDRLVRHTGEHVRGEAVRQHARFQLDYFQGTLLSKEFLYAPDSVQALLEFAPEGYPETCSTSEGRAFIEELRVLEHQLPVDQEKEVAAWIKAFHL